MPVSASTHAPTCTCAVTHEYIHFLNGVNDSVCWGLLLKQVQLNSSSIPKSFISDRWQQFVVWVELGDQSFAIMGARVCDGSVLHIWETVCRLACDFEVRMFDAGDFFCFFVMVTRVKTEWEQYNRKCQKMWSNRKLCSESCDVACDEVPLLGLFVELRDVLIETDFIIYTWFFVLEAV